MRTVHEVSELAGVSIRTLQYYDKIGLLRPAARTEAGYRLYDDGNLERLQQILLFRELEFPLKDIRRIVESPDFDRTRALDQQIELLELKRERIDGLIALAKDIRAKGAESRADNKTDGKEKAMGSVSFEAFDKSKVDEYTAQAKASWGDTAEWTEFEQKSARRTAGEEEALGAELMALFKPFGRMALEGADPAGEEARAQAGRIQNFISEHYYRCSDEVFAQLGQMYGAGGDFTRNINDTAGEGAAEFAAKAVAAHLNKATRSS